MESVEDPEFSSPPKTYKIFITKLLESPIPRIKNPVISSIFKVNLLPNILVIYFYITRFSSIEVSFFIAWICIYTIFLNIAPPILWYYDERILPSFFKNSLDLFPNEEKMRKYVEKFDKMFHNRFFITTIPWTAMMVFIYIISDNTMVRGGLFGYSDPFYWLLFIVYVWLNLMVGCALWGLIVTIRAIREIARHQLQIDPLHPDKVGGLSSVGDYAIATTLVLSAGALWLPVAFELTVGGNEIYRQWVIFVVFLWMLVVLLSFLYPTVLINIQAKKIRDRILDKLRRDYSESKSHVDPSDRTRSNEDIIVHHFRLEMIRNEYHDYKAMKLYPFEITIMSKLITSLLLPLLIWWVQTYLPTLI